MLRIGAGEPTIELPAILQYPSYDPETGQQLYPFRAIAVAAAMLCHVVVSWVTTLCFRSGVLPASCNVLGGERQGEMYVVNQGDVGHAEDVLHGRKLMSRTDYVRESYLLYNQAYTPDVPTK